MYKRLTTLASLKATLIGENLKKKVKDGKYTILMQTFVDENQALMMTFSKARNGILSIVSPPPPSQVESRSPSDSSTPPSNPSAPSSTPTTSKIVQQCHQKDKSSTPDAAVLLFFFFPFFPS